MDLPADVEEALALAGRKPTGIEGCAEALPAGFTEIPAACFLIANMRWHYSDDSGYCCTVMRKDSDLCDLQRFDRSFLISHVDHALM